MPNAVSNPVVVSREDARANGASTFFTGKACRNGHVSPRSVQSGRCNECSAAKNSRQYQAHREDRIASASEYAKANASKVADYQKAYRVANKDAIKAYQSKYRAENQEALREYDRKRDRSGNASRLSYQRIWNASNKHKLSGYHRKWAANNPHIIRQISSNRRAMKLRASVGWEAELMGLVEIEAHDLAIAREKATGVAWHVDHMFPLKADSVCGLHVWNNLQVIPATLNTQKKNRILLTDVGEWVSYIGGCNA